MRTPPYAVSAPAVAAVLGAAGALALHLAPERLTGLTAGALVCFVAFVFWPWAVLPVGIVGGVAATKAVPTAPLANSQVAFVVVVHAAVLAAGCLALLARHLAFCAGDQPRRTPADRSMALLAALVAAGALYGLARGHAPHRVLVATYEIAIIPAYYFLATHTLTTARRLRAASILYATAAAVLAATEMTVPGRHGGLLSALAIPPLLVAVTGLRGWRRAAALVLIALFVGDVIVASYRSVWLATGLAVLILLACGSGHLRRSLAMGIAAGAVFTVAVGAVSAGWRARSTLVGEHLDDDAGYRLSEMAVGLRVFAAHPLAGDGLGQTTPHVYLPGFAITNVGPIYHVFYVMILANLGLAGLIAVSAPLWRALRVAWAARDPRTLAFLALTCGFIAAAASAGPTDGHWELGVLPALALLANQRPAGHAGVEGSRP
ncbi:O-antigen ligase family protein [Gandjariella thermophila]|uniref:O-antigen ligase-related domain-containing protein n=1 Tax=Gandjariella thermophila TaxID=1931992 RepID=A0A4D4JEU5_9PSEU|nr:O-antigen ligase family protein [Gandjariella thermophila]GDY33550.1 hypothetical protein GTS_51830 [Gandjariella thermophila]